MLNGIDAQGNKVIYCDFVFKIPKQQMHGVKLSHDILSFEERKLNYYLQPCRGSGTLFPTKFFFFLSAMCQF